MPFLGEASTGAGSGGAITGTGGAFGGRGGTTTGAGAPISRVLPVVVHPVQAVVLQQHREGGEEGEPVLLVPHLHSRVQVVVVR